MKTGKILLALALVAASFSAASAAGPKSDVELAKQLKSQMKCEGGANLNCSLTFRGLEIQFADMKNPAGGAMAVIDMASTQKYTKYGARCMMIEFTDKDLLPSVSAKSTGIVFRSDGTILPSSNVKEADAACF